MTAIDADWAATAAPPQGGKIGFRTRYCNATFNSAGAPKPLINATIPRHAWTMNVNAEEGAEEDSYRFNPWRAPGCTLLCRPGWLQSQTPPLWLRLPLCGLVRADRSRSLLHFWVPLCFIPAESSVSLLREVRPDRAGTPRSSTRAARLVANSLRRRSGAIRSSLRMNLQRWVTWGLACPRQRLRRRLNGWWGPV